MVGVDMGTEVTAEARSIHPLDICSLVCDMLELVPRGWREFGPCVAFPRRWMLESIESRDMLDDSK